MQSEETVLTSERPKYLEQGANIRECRKAGDCVENEELVFQVNWKQENFVDAQLDVQTCPWAFLAVVMPEGGSNSNVYQLMVR